MEIPRQEAALAPRTSQGHEREEAAWAAAVGLTRSVNATPRKLRASLRGELKAWGVVFPQHQYPN